MIKSPSFNAISNIKKVKDLFGHEWMKLNEIVLHKYPDVSYDQINCKFINYDGVDHCTAETKVSYTTDGRDALIGTAIDIMDVSEAKAGYDKIGVLSDSHVIAYIGYAPGKYKFTQQQFLLHENLYNRFQHHDFYKQERCKAFFIKE